MHEFDEYLRRTWVPDGDIAPEQSELATSLRVPILATSYPHWNYVTGIVIDHALAPYLRFPGVVPTELEVRVVGSFLEQYCKRWYNERFRNVMAQFAPYDIDGGANLGYLLKKGEGSWSYRKRTWTGSSWWPHDDVAIPLVEVLDRCHGAPDWISPRWVEWKAAHPEVFGVSGR